MKTMLILGSNSFTGYYFKKFFHNNNLLKEITLYATDKDDRDIHDCPDINYIKTNALDKDDLANLIKGVKPDYMVNLVGTFSAPSYEAYIKVNVDISRNIFEIINKCGLHVEKVLVIGSAAEYGRVRELPVRETAAANPVNLYGLSKLMQTIISVYYYNNYGINVNIARTFNITGKGISDKLAVGNFAGQIERASDGETIFTGNLSSKRDYLHIEDVVKAYWRILTIGHTGEIYNVCGGKSISMEDMLFGMINKSGKSLKVATNERFLKSDEIEEIYGDNSKLMAHTKWAPERAVI